MNALKLSTKGSAGSHMERLQGVASLPTTLFS